MTEINRTPRHPGQLARHPLELQQKTDRRRAAAHHHHTLAGECFARHVVRRVHLRSLEGIRTRVVRHERRAPGAGRVDDYLRVGLLVAENRGTRGHDQGGLNRNDAGHGHGAHDIEPEVPLIVAVIVADDVTCRQGVIGRIKAQAEFFHTGKIVDAVRRSELQCLPAVLPGTAGARASIENNEVPARNELKPTQVKRNGQPGLAGADDDDGYAGIARHATPFLRISRANGVRGAQGAPC